MSGRYEMSCPFITYLFRQREKNRFRQTPGHWCVCAADDGMFHEFTILFSVLQDPGTPQCTGSVETGTRGFLRRGEQEKKRTDPQGHWLSDKSVAVLRPCGYR